MEYRREIDGLRAIAVLSVVLFHAGIPAFSGGFVGVDVFFVISGYLIAKKIIESFERGTFSFAEFYERRARRILPALFIVTVASFLVGIFILPPGEMKDLSRSILASAVFLSNVYFWKTSGYFDQAGDLKPLLHTWSLSVEEQFYLVFPLFFVLALRRSRTVAMAVILLVLAVSLIAANWGPASKPLPAFFSLPTRAWELMSGVLVALVLADRKPDTLPAVFRNLLVALGQVLVIAPVFILDKNSGIPKYYAIYPVFGAAILIALIRKGDIVSRLLGSRVLVSIGLISYSAYLWHQPIFAYARIYVEPAPGYNGISFLLALTFVLSCLTWRFVETPWRDHARWPGRPVRIVLIAATLGFVLLGLLGEKTNGFLFRYRAEDRALAAIEMREAGQYVQRRFNLLSMRPFDPADPRRKVLVIGDSFAQDMANAVYESSFKDIVQLSTFHVSAGCDSLFIPAVECARTRQEKRILPLLEPDSKNTYEDARLRQLMRAADEIWFVAAWQDWQADSLRESVVNIGAFAGASIRIFGRKDFGRVVLRDLIAMKPGERFRVIGRIEPGARQVNARLKEAVTGLERASFVDVQRAACGENGADCPLFTEGGALKSYDGGHLTREGAHHLGARLMEETAFRDWFMQQKPTLSP